MTYDVVMNQGLLNWVGNGIGSEMELDMRRDCARSLQPLDGLRRNYRIINETYAPTYVANSASSVCYVTCNRNEPTRSTHLQNGLCY
jgi:hypothetical protein